MTFVCPDCDSEMVVNPNLDFSGECPICGSYMEEHTFFRIMLAIGTYIAIAVLIGYGLWRVFA